MVRYCVSMSNCCYSLKEQEDPTSAQSDNTAELKLVQILYSKGLEIFRGRF